jgi:hypothetical protein
MREGGSMIVDGWWTNASQEDIAKIVAKVRRQWDAVCDGEPGIPLGSELSEWELNALTSMFVAALMLLREANKHADFYEEDELRGKIERLIYEEYPMGTIP